MNANPMRVLATLSLLLAPAFAEDHFLTIAGGYESTGNQVSLEKNVIFFRHVLDKAGLADAKHDVYFANGAAKNRDLQFEPADADVSRSQELMARLFGSTKYQRLEYRKHQLDNITGATTPENVAKWFDENAKKMKVGDRLIVYATAHGGKSSDKKNDGNTTLYLWGKKTVNVNQLQTHLEKLPDGVGVTFVMAQCYSGGFANSIFDGANKESDDFEFPVAGFFSTVHSRQAAGCTPDINEEDYDEFSSHFWAAINGESRVGNLVDAADYDGNGMVDFDEAFAYTVIVSQNIDIPIKTSGVYLRARSKYRREDRENQQLLAQKGDFAEVLKLAKPAERAMLESISEQLGLKDAERYAEAEEAANAIEKERTNLQNQINGKKKRQDELRKALQRRLRERWPELANILSAQAVRLLTDEADAFVAEVEQQPDFREWQALQTERDELDSERFVLEKKWAKHIRFMRAHNNVVLAKNLQVLGDKAAIARYAKIVANERGALKTDS